MMNTFKYVYIFSHQNIKCLVEIISYGVNKEKRSAVLFVDYTRKRSHVSEWIDGSGWEWDKKTSDESWRWFEINTRSQSLKDRILRYVIFLSARLNWIFLWELLCFWDSTAGSKTKWTKKFKFTVKCWLIKERKEEEEVWLISKDARRRQRMR